MAADHRELSGGGVVKDQVCREVDCRALMFKGNSRRQCAIIDVLSRHNTIMTAMIHLGRKSLCPFSLSTLKLHISKSPSWPLGPRWGREPIVDLKINPQIMAMQYYALKKNI